MKVIFEYYRIYDEDALDYIRAHRRQVVSDINISMKPEVVRSRSGRCCWSAFPRGGVTRMTLILSETDGVPVSVMSSATCSFRDNFNKRVGRSRAAENMLAALTEIGVNEDVLDVVRSHIVQEKPKLPKSPFMSDELLRSLALLLRSNNVSQESKDKIVDRVKADAIKREQAKTE
jgi:hypothetical protein